MGTDWLNYNKAIIDFNDNTICLNGQKTEITLCTDKIFNKIIEKDFNIKDLIKEEYPSNYKENEFGKIHSTKMSLKIDESKLKRPVKEYQVPIKYKEMTEKHVKELFS